MLLLRTASGSLSGPRALSHCRRTATATARSPGPAVRADGSQARAGRLLRHAGPYREVAAEPDLRACSSSPCDLIRVQEGERATLLNGSSGAPTNSAFGSEESQCRPPATRIAAAHISPCACPLAAPPVLYIAWAGAAGAEIRFGSDFSIRPGVP